ncbi:hypothetical protein ACHAXA_000264 [Cyclostephanos tholiformis]|uniref:J domain-containing protein n=1 Tax=Cyclostephanos tholiformis TaxID=382380 RepID=A0ABD3SB83_9STRA
MKTSANFEEEIEGHTTSLVIPSSASSRRPGPKAARTRYPPRPLLTVLLLLFPSIPPPPSSPWRRWCSILPPPAFPPSVVPATATTTGNNRNYNGGGGGGGGGGLYSTLGIPRTASSSDIKRAYRKMALRHHPDKVPEGERHAAERRFKEIAKAYEWLGDERKRKLYDRYGERSLDPTFVPGPFDGAYAHASADGARSGGGGGGGDSFRFGNGGFPGGGFGGLGGFANVDLNEILRRMMGGGGGMHPPHGMETRRSHGAGTGGGTTSGWFGDVPGGRDGMGDRHRRPSSSSSGGGGHKRRRRRRTPSPPRPVHCSLDELCMGCTKRFRVTYPASDVAVGGGGGIPKQRERVYEVRIEPGGRDGTLITFPRDEAADLPSIAFVIREREHPYLERAGDDLVWRCRLSTRQAERGAKIKLPLPDGSLLEVESKGGTKTGDRTRVAGRGMPSMADGGRRGDVLIEFVVG